MSLERATWWDRFLELTRQTGLEHPTYVPDDVALAWLTKEHDVLDLTHIPQEQQKARGRIKGWHTPGNVEGVTVHQTGTLIGGGPERWVNFAQGAQFDLPSSVAGEPFSAKAAPDWIAEEFASVAKGQSFRGQVLS